MAIWNLQFTSSDDAPLYTEGAMRSARDRIASNSKVAAIASWLAASAPALLKLFPRASAWLGGPDERNAYLDGRSDGEFGKRAEAPEIVVARLKIKLACATDEEAKTKFRDAIATIEAAFGSPFETSEPDDDEPGDD